MTQIPSVQSLTVQSGVELAHLLTAVSAGSLAVASGTRVRLTQSDRDRPAR